MPNPYYNETFTAALGSQARSRALDVQFNLVEQGFDLLFQQIQNLQGLNGLNFIDLLDAPGSYTGSALYQLRVNNAESAVEFVSAGRVVIKVVGGTTYTFVASDAGALVVFTNGSAVTATINTGVFSQGDVVMVQQKGAGQVTIAAGGGVTVNSSDNLMATRTQHAQIAFVCLGSEEFTLIGERNAATLGFASLTGGNHFSGAQTVAFYNLTDAATINTDASLSNHFFVVLGGNRTLANPTNLRDGGIYNWWIKQDGAGSKTLAYGNLFKWPGGTVPTLTTGANGLDLIVGQYNSIAGILACTITKDIR